MFIADDDPCPMTLVCLRIHVLLTHIGEGRYADA